MRNLTIANSLRTDHSVWEACEFDETRVGNVVEKGNCEGGAATMQDEAE